MMTHRQCVKCGKTKEIELFRSYKRRKCRKCEYDLAQSSGYKTQWQTKRRLEMRSVIDASKDIPCADCNIKFNSMAMEFDHVRGMKEFDISLATQTIRSINKLKAEIAKCEVVCARCHADRTHRNNQPSPGRHTRSWRRKEQFRVIAREAKNVPCTDCNTKFNYWQMELDHIGVKVANINHMCSQAMKFSIEELKAEISKCEVVCVNCHRARTQERSESSSCPKSTSEANSVV